MSAPFVLFHLLGLLDATKGQRQR